MPIQLISTIKSWFQTGSAPTEQQFSDVFDSYRHKNDAIPVSEVTGLDTELTQMNDTVSTTWDGATVEIDGVDYPSIALPNAPADFEYVFKNRLLVRPSEYQYVESQQKLAILSALSEMTVGDLVDIRYIRKINSAPVIILNGEEVMELAQNDTFTEPGYTATDAEDGDITANVVVTGTVDTATIGAYTLTYSVTDSAGLTSTVTRTVNVVSGVLKLIAPLNLVASVNLNAIWLQWEDQNETYRRTIKIVVLGSSTANGSGTTPENKWVTKFTTNLEGVSADVTVLNAAVGGYDSYKYMPDSFTPPTGRPTPDTAANITYAIAQNPDFIILNNAGNDISNNYDEETETKPNYLAIQAAADTAGIPLYWTTLQPRTTLNYTQRLRLQVFSAWILTQFTDHAFNIYDSLTLFTPEEQTTDLTILPACNSGDDVHLNANGHQIICDIISAVFENMINNSARSSSCIIERSTLPVSGFTVLASIDELLETYIDNSVTPGTEYYYRVKDVAISGYTDSDYSDTDSATVPVSSLTQIVKVNLGPASAAANWNNVTANSSFNLDNLSGVASNCSIAPASFSLNGMGGAYPDSGTGLNLPDDVMTSAFYAGGVARTITFTGQAGKKYKFKLFGSRTGSGSAISDYTIGGTTYSLECIDNTSNIIESAKLELDVNNEISIVVAKNVSNTSAAYINALVIEEYSS